MKHFRLLLAAVTAVALSGCTHHDAGHDAHAEEAEHHHDDNEIVVSPSDAARFGIEVEGLKRTPFAEIVKVSGEILPSGTGRAVVSARNSGIVRIAPGISEGSAVKAGQTIATVAGGAVAGGDAVNAARVTLETAGREVQRLKPLLDDGLITVKEYNEAVTAYELAKAQFSPAAASGTATAVRDGVITQLFVSDGSYVEAGGALAEITAPTRLTLRALLPASESRFLPMITDAVVTPHGGEPIRLTTLGGRISSASSATGASVPGYVPVYFTFDSTNPSLVPGSAVEVYLSSAPAGEYLSVPVEALSESMGQMFVYVKTDDHGYEKRPVTTGRSDGERVVVTHGVAEGDSVVTRGTTFVRLAEKATVVPEGHSHNH